MSLKRLTERLKCMKSSFREWKASDIGRKNEAGLVEALRFCSTSNGYQQRNPFEERIEEEIVNALHLGQRSRASNLLSDLGSRDRALKVGYFIPILRYCARTPDPLFAMETWKLMMEKDIKLSGICYFFTVKALCKGGYLTEALSLVSFQRENSDIYPTLPVYNNLLKACIQMNSLNHAGECLHMMEQEGVRRDIVTYTFLLRLAVMQQDLSAVREIWRECVNYYCLNTIILRKFIWSFTILRDLESAYVALEQMVAMAFHHKFSTNTTYKERLCDSRLDILSISEYNKENDSNNGVRFGIEAIGVRGDALILPEQPLSGTVTNFLRHSFGDIIQACARSRNIMLAEQLMLQMQNLGLEPCSNTYDGLIKALVSVKGFHDGMEVLKVMQQKNMKPKNSTLAALSVSCSRGLELDLAETFLGQISKCNHVYPFNEFLEACDTLDKPERAVWALAKLKYLNLMPDIRTYELLFSLFGNVNVPYEDGNMLSQADTAKRINAIEIYMMRHGIQHSHVSMQNLLKSLGMEGMKEELIQYLHVAENQFFYRSGHLGMQIYDTVLHSLVEAKESHLAIKIFKNMISCGLSPNAATYTIMIDCCGIIKCYRSACALISMMIRDGFGLNVVTYTTLIKILLNSEAFIDALELLDQASSEGIQPDLLMYNAFLRAASEKGRIDVVELIVEKMHQDKIQPDPSTCSHVFSAYVENGFHSTAMEALQVLSMRMISEEDNILEENRLQYEYLVFDESSEAESQIIEVFKNSPYLAVALLNLRWCATILSSISWLPNESLWAKRLSSNYASTHRG